jgi:hypothetical protein
LFDLQPAAKCRRSVENRPRGNVRFAWLTDCCLGPGRRKVLPGGWFQEREFAGLPGWAVFLTI